MSVWDADNIGFLVWTVEGTLLQCCAYGTFGEVSYAEKIVGYKYCITNWIIYNESYGFIAILVSLNVHMTDRIWGRDPTLKPLFWCPWSTLIMSSSKQVHHIARHALFVNSVRHNNFSVFSTIHRWHTMSYSSINEPLFDCNPVETAGLLLLLGWKMYCLVN